MKSKIVILILILSMTTIIADNPVFAEIKEGKNIVITNDSFSSYYASQIMEKYPQIESISMRKYGMSFGYVNTMGGLGTNIIIEPNQEYEIYSTENLTIEFNS